MLKVVQNIPKIQELWRTTTAPKDYIDNMMPMGIRVWEISVRKHNIFLLKYYYIQVTFIICNFLKYLFIDCIRWFCGMDKVYHEATCLALSEYLRNIQQGIFSLASKVIRKNKNIILLSIKFR